MRRMLAMLMIAGLSHVAIAADVKPTLPSDKELATHATALGDNDFDALKARMKPKITEPCPVTTADGAKIQAPAATCQCISDAYFKQVTKVDFEQFVQTNQVRLDDRMQAAQKKCMLDLPPPVEKPHIVTSDDRYLVLTTIQNECLAEAQKDKQGIDVTVRNECGCKANQRLAAMTDKDINTYLKGNHEATVEQKKQMVNLCKK